MKIVDLSAEASPRSLLAFTMQGTNCLLAADCNALTSDGERVPEVENRTVSSLRVTEPKARLASWSVSSSSRQNVSQAT